MAFDKKEDLKPVMSEQMLKNGKRLIAKFGFEIFKYEDFLRSVKAMNGYSVMVYPNYDIEKYREQFVKHIEVGLNDTFMFDELAKIRYQDEKKGWHEKDEFCPRQFWDYILKK
jgi:hypothetical protein